MHARRAYGSHRRMTTAQKARNIAEAIQRKYNAGEEWDLREYGIENNASMIQAVLEHLEKLQTPMK